MSEFSDADVRIAIGEYLKYGEKTFSENGPGGHRGYKRPTATQVRAARTRAGLTQSAAADLVHVTVRNWQQWEAGERKMSAGLWELFRAKTFSRRKP